jgi:uncharacterized protein YjdB
MAAVAAGACGNLPTTSEGVAFLELRPPAILTITVGDSLRIGARALDQAGQPVAVVIHWRTPDTTTVSVGDTSGVVTGRAAGTGRVQAVIGDDELVSDFVTVTVQAPAPSPFRRP